MFLLTISLLLLTGSLGQINLHTATIHEITSVLHQKDISCEELIRIYLRRIEKFDKNWPKIRAVVTRNPFAISEAKERDSFLERSGNLTGPLHCIAVLVSDNIDVAGLPTTAGIQALIRSIPNVHSDVVAQLLDAGAVVIGKGNVAPFAEETRQTVSETGGMTRNPYAPDYTTYGSCGGTAAGVAAGFAVIGIATDADGSIMRTASANNLIGFRPTWTRISGKGALPNVYLQDTVGVLVKHAGDLAAIMDVIDPVALNKEGAVYSTPIVLDENGLDGLAVGLPTLYAYDTFSYYDSDRKVPLSYALDKSVQKQLQHALYNMKAAGAKLENATLTLSTILNFILQVNQLKPDLSACKSNWLDQYFGQPKRFHPASPYHSVEELIQGNRLPANLHDSFNDDLNNREKCPEAAEKYVEIRKKFTDTVLNSLFENNHILLLPTTAEYPQLLAVSNSRLNASASILTDISGYPSISVPVGFSQPTEDAPQGLPVGILLVADPSRMDLLMQVAYAYQKKHSVLLPPWTVDAEGEDSLHIKTDKNGKDNVDSKSWRLSWDRSLFCVVFIVLFYCYG